MKNLLNGARNKLVMSTIHTGPGQCDLAAENTLKFSLPQYEPIIVYKDTSKGFVTAVVTLNTH